MSTESAIGAGRPDRAVHTTTVEPPSLSDAKKAVTAPDGPSNDLQGADGVTADHTFDLDYLDSRGRRWAGRFKCHALTYREKISVGLTRSKLSGGVSPHLLDVTTGQMLEMLAHLAIALDDAPKWAAKLEDVHDPGVVASIYEEVAKHEARFHGTGPEGSGASADDEPGGHAGTGVAAQDG